MITSLTNKLPKRRPDNDADSHIDNIALHDKLFELLNQSHHVNFLAATRDDRENVAHRLRLLALVKSGVKERGLVGVAGRIPPIALVCSLPKERSLNALTFAPQLIQEAVAFLWRWHTAGFFAAEQPISQPCNDSVGDVANGGRDQP